ncbi:sterol regulatory element binding protein, transcription factor sre1 [Gigaspora margarita]|uniref:Sterol regulatory element binding protein, transcription factor sre1 n=1 Tax=Gigaspora margarita TaxID=4874 RepID=A0A8H4EMR6_GIGMA|nr:sterol regulatory element binding protein, transcription factor sre1 [Gigaspora margarita]
MNRNERLLEIELWNQLGEAELCGNKHATRLSILYTCLRTINLLENSCYNRNVLINPSRIYANTALQDFINYSFTP